MAFIRKHSLVVGIVAIFLLTWPVYSKLGIFVGWGVSAAALIVTAIAEGRAGVSTLLRRFLLWRVPFKWYLVALAGPAGLYLLALALFTFTLGFQPDPTLTEAHAIFGPAANPFLLAIPFLVFDAVTNGEELGWRGFALTRLQARRSALASSLILGAIWGLWHFPKFLTAPTLQPFSFAIAHNMIVAILYTWVFNGTGGSLLLATLLHASFSTAYVLLPVNPAAAGSQLIQLYTLAVEALAALAVVTLAGPLHLGRRERIQHSLPSS